MLSNYSWSEFIIVIGISAVVYYFYVILRYYRNEFSDFVFGKNDGRKIKHSDGLIQAENFADGGVLTKTTDNQKVYGVGDDYSSSLDIELLMDNIKQIVSNAAQYAYSEQHLLELLREAMKSYPSVNEPILRDSINEFIQKVCEDKGVALLTEEDVDVLWDDAGDQSGNLPVYAGR